MESGRKRGFQPLRHSGRRKLLSFFRRLLNAVSFFLFIGMKEDEGEETEALKRMLQNFQLDRKKIINKGLWSKPQEMITMDLSDYYYLS